VKLYWELLKLTLLDLLNNTFMKLHWGNYILIFIILFLTLCTIFIVFSLRQDRDLVIDDYYEIGADYSQKMETRDRSAVFIDSVYVKEKKNYFLVKFSPGLSLDIDELTLYFYRPSGKSEDFISEYEIKGDSVVVNKKNLSTGRYILKISWLIGDDDFMVEQEIFVN